MKLVSWNMRRLKGAWSHLLEAGADVALLQEATPPPPDIAPAVDADPGDWSTPGAGKSRAWRAAVAKLSERVELEWWETGKLGEAGAHQLAVSRPGTIAAATVKAEGVEPFVAISMYGLWETAHPMAGGREIYADAAVHRLISDISALVVRRRGHRIIAAGDLNILHGYGEHGSAYWAGRYASVFGRMEALGLKFVGPQSPGGRVADPWPHELPADSENVPTYHHNRQRPETATRQLDFVFASDGFSEGVRARALNSPECWGPSDHCMVEIEVG